MTLDHMTEIDEEPDLHELTLRQDEILQYLMDGYHMNQVAQLLGVTYRTIKQHMTDARHRYGAKTNIELVVMICKEKG